MKEGSGIGPGLPGGAGDGKGECFDPDDLPIAIRIGVARARESFHDFRARH